MEFVPLVTLEMKELRLSSKATFTSSTRGEKTEEGDPFISKN